MHVPRCTPLSRSRGSELRRQIDKGDMDEQTHIEAGSLPRVSAGGLSACGSASPAMVSKRLQKSWHGPQSTPQDLQKLASRRIMRSHHAVSTEHGTMSLAS